MKTGGNGPGLTVERVGLGAGMETGEWDRKKKKEGRDEECHLV